MNGSFEGVVDENKVNKSMKYYEWSSSYEDKANKIQYNMSCIKNGSMLMEIYSLQGLDKPEVRKFDNVSWNIYYSKATPTVNNSKSNDKNGSIDVYVCEANHKGITYLIYVVSSGKTIQCDGSLYCDLYKKKIEPMLKSLSFHENSKAPELYKILGLQKSDMKILSKQLKEAQTKARTVAM